MTVMGGLLSSCQFEQSSAPVTELATSWALARNFTISWAYVTNSVGSWQGPLEVAGQAVVARAIVLSNSRLVGQQ